MRRAARPLLILAVALLPVTSILLAQSDRPARGWFRCDTNTGGDTIYATPFFDWTGTFNVLQNAFAQHLLAKYGYKGRVSCSMATPGGNSLANLQADMQRQYTQFRAQGKKIVELSWTILSPGVTLAYQCFGLAQVRRAGMPDSTYLLHSGVERITIDNAGELSTEWTDELKRLHPGWYFRSPGCNLLPADPADHAAVLNSMAEMYASSKPKVTQLDWEFVPGAQPAPTKAPDPATSQPPAAPAAAAESPSEYPTVDRFGRPLPPLNFYCQYLGLALDASGKYPIYQAEPFTMATLQGAVQNAWNKYIEATYHPSSPGNPMCAVLPTDPTQREAAMKSFNLLTQPATQKVVKTGWKP